MFEYDGALFSGGVGSFEVQLSDSCGGQEVVLGCVDELACNYDPLATLQSSEVPCEYASCTSDCLVEHWSYCYGSNESWTFPLVSDEGGIIIVDVSGNDIELGWDQMTITDANSGIEIYNSNSAFGVTEVVGSDSLLVSFESDASESCLSGGWNGASYSIGLSVTCASIPSGTCYELDACNYLEGDYAFTDNSTCDYSCYGDCPLFEMTDSFGDGWNGGAYFFVSESGDTVFTGTLTGGAYGFDEICIDPGCYELIVTGGMYPTEIAWMFEYDGALFSGGVGSHQLSMLGAGGECSGCADSTACNYQEFAVFPDNSCFWPDDDPEGSQFCSNGLIWNSETNQCESSSFCSADLDGDGFVTVMDILIFLPNFGSECTSPVEYYGSCDCSVAEEDSWCEILCGFYSMSEETDCYNLTSSLCGDGTIWSHAEGQCVQFDLCEADLDGSNEIGIADLLLLLGSFASSCN